MSSKDIASTDPIFYLLSGDRNTIKGASQADLTPEALGQKLERLIRFQGQPGAFSVARHMVLCGLLAETQWGISHRLVRWALTHDVAEAFTGDYHGLYKGQEAKDFENSIDRALNLRGWDIEHEPEIKVIDLMARDFEKSSIWPKIPCDVSEPQRWPMYCSLSQVEGWGSIWAGLVRHTAGYET